MATDSVYGRITTDFMFKRIFGSEDNKDILIKFLKDILEDKDICDVTFRNVEHFGPSKDDKRVTFDVFVRTDKGEEYIVEMQLGRERYFSDRALYYLSYPIMEQGRLAKQPELGLAAQRWNYCLKSVKLIGVLNFQLEHNKDWPEERYHSSYSLREDKSGELLIDKLQIIFLEIARFNKSESEIETPYDKWMYLFKNIQQLSEQPGVFTEKEFDHLFEIAKICNLRPEEYEQYKHSIDMDFSYYNSLEYAAEESYKKGLLEGVAQGREEGIAEGREAGIAEGKAKLLATVAALKAAGVDVLTIAKCTGFSAEEIAKL